MARSIFRRKTRVEKSEVLNWENGQEKGIIGWSDSDNTFKFTDKYGNGSYLAPSSTAGAYSSAKTIKKTLGGVGVADCDFNFASAANTTEQPIDLGAIIPAKARVIDIVLYTDIAFSIAGATKTLVADVGNATGGAQFIASGTIYAVDAIRAVAAGDAHKALPNKAATHVWINGTPGQNWSTVLNGKVSIYITYLDLTGV